MPYDQANAFTDIAELQDIGLIIKPLPMICQWVGFGPINLAELLQARVCSTPALAMLKNLSKSTCI